MYAQVTIINHLLTDLHNRVCYRLGTTNR